MEKYRSIVQKRIMLLMVLTIVGIGIQIVGSCNLFGITGRDFTDGAVVGFQMGLLFGIIGVSIGLTIRYGLALKDETKLKKLYNTENDERRKVIKQKSGGNVMLVSTCIIILVGIIAGYFNHIVFLSLVGAAIFQLMICVILKAYYSTKY
ncbi:MAG: hypothetical protein AB9856_09445 [Cellulosilyticaceae bacterium]